MGLQPHADKAQRCGPMHSGVAPEMRRDGEPQIAIAGHLRTVHEKGGRSGTTAPLFDVLDRGYCTVNVTEVTSTPSESESCMRKSYEPGSSGASNVRVPDVWPCR